MTEWDKLGKAWTTQIQAHQAAESLPWEPGVIIRPIQRGPGTLGAREAGPHWSASAVGGSGDLAGPCGRAGALDGGLCVYTHSISETCAPTGHVNTSTDTGEKSVQEATRCVDSAKRLFIPSPDCTALPLSSLELQVPFGPPSH